MGKRRETLRIDARFLIEADPNAVWKVLRDPEMVATCFPGAELDERADDGSYRGHITVRFGPTIASFAGHARIEIDDVARSAAIDASGVDRRGSSRAKAHTVVRLVPDGMSSVVELLGSIDMTGPLAGFAETGGVHVTNELLKSFAHSVEQRIAPVAPGSPERGVKKNEIHAFALLFAVIKGYLAALPKRWHHRKRSQS